MDILSNPNNVPSRQAEWPTAPAKRGRFYGVNDPVFKKDMLCVMTMDTWTDVGTMIANHEKVTKLQNGKIIELQAANGALAAQLRDANERLRNLRRVRRKEMRNDIEKYEPELAQADATDAPVVPPTKFF